MNACNKWSPTTHLKWLSFQNFGLFQWFLKWIYALTEKHNTNSTWKNLCTDCIILNIYTTILLLNTNISFSFTMHENRNGIHWSYKFLPNNFSYGEINIYIYISVRGVGHFSHCFISLTAQYKLHSTFQTGLTPLPQEFDAYCLLKRNWYLSFKHFMLRLE